METKMNGLSIELLSHPGETLLEVLESNNMTQKELAARIGVTAKHINRIVAGKESIGPETAFKLEKVFSNISASFWNTLQANYDSEYMQVIESETVSEEEKAVFNNNTYTFLVNENYLERMHDINSKVIQMRSFLGVSNLCNIDNMLNANARFRKSSRVSMNNFALAAWMKVCELKTDEVAVDNQLDINGLLNELDVIKKLNNLSDMNEISIRLKDIFARHGIAFAVVKSIAGAPVQGFIRKINNKTRLCMTIRGKWLDIFWFTLFHEIGHLKDIENELYLEFDERTNNASEMSADFFACDNLIDRIKYKNYVKNKENINKNSIINFCEEQHIKPGILVGRMQHDGIIKYSEYNELREKVLC